MFYYRQFSHQASPPTFSSSPTGFSSSDGKMSSGHLQIISNLSSVASREGLGGTSAESPSSSISLEFPTGSAASPFESSLCASLRWHIPVSFSLSSIFLAFLFSARQQHFSKSSSPLPIPIPIPLPLAVVLVVLLVLSLLLSEMVSGYTEHAPTRRLCVETYPSGSTGGSTGSAVAQ